MDPDETLRRIRAQVEEAHTNEGIDDPAEFVGLVEALDMWLSKGGHLPEPWDRPPW